MLHQKYNVLKDFSFFFRHTNFINFNFDFIFQMNGNVDPQGGATSQRNVHDYKLLIDPCLVKGQTQKIYRYDGIIPGDVHPVIVKDPRNVKALKLRQRLDPIELPVPRFIFILQLNFYRDYLFYRFSMFTLRRHKIDQNYVGEPPAVETTITNLNDNIDKQFLNDMLQKCGPIDELVIYYHPLTKRHLSLARVVFIDVKSARDCVEKFNNKAVMGKVALF